MKRFFMYLIRWQLSAPLIAIIIAYFIYLGEWAAVSLANLLAAIICFWVDRWIFKERDKNIVK